MASGFLYLSIESVRSQLSKKCLCLSRGGGKLVLFSLELGSQILDLLVGQNLTPELEHLRFFFLDVMLNIFLQHLCLGGPLFAVNRHSSQLGEQRLNHVMLLNTFKGDVASLGFFLECRIEDRFFNVRVNVEFFF